VVLEGLASAPFPVKGAAKTPTGAKRYGMAGDCKKINTMPLPLKFLLELAERRDVGVF
jgi:hypothetical protein